MQLTDPNKFTEKAWEAIVKSQDVARRFKNQQLEVEHLAIALLEQTEGLTHRILNRAEIDIARLTPQLEAFATRQPKVAKLDQLYLGRGLDVLLDRAEEARATWQDELLPLSIS
jgi:ATP-dependent Clp protease ATP-binding subunit ClpB